MYGYQTYLFELSFAVPLTLLVLGTRFSGCYGIHALSIYLAMIENAWQSMMQHYWSGSL